MQSIGIGDMNAINYTQLGAPWAFVTIGTSQRRYAISICAEVAKLLPTAMLLPASDGSQYVVDRDPVELSDRRV
jgi:hypothetical protein